MCGIAGLLRPGGGDESELSAAARHMTDALAHRGPDASGYWTKASAGIAFGHRRLSVLDLSQAGSQPMHSDCGRFTVTFNGEIYNHLDIRDELEGAGIAPNWRGRSDTETLLCAVRHWGVVAVARSQCADVVHALCLCAGAVHHLDRHPKPSVRILRHVCRRCFSRRHAGAKAVLVAA